MKRILLITTGGTIGGNVAEEKKTTEIVQESDKFGEILSDIAIKIEIDHLKQKNENIKLEITHRELCDIDSSDIQPQHWIDLSKIIKEEYDNFEAFLITHGTNTMGYTSSALSFALPNLNKAVIITGSQVPAGMPGSDAITNLENSLRVAILGGKQKIKGVVAVFGSQIISGTRVKKSTEFDYDAFKSFGDSALGQIGRIIEINKANLDKHLRYIDESKVYPPAKKAADLECQNHFDMSIASLTEFPGMDYEILKNLASQNSIRGFILRAFGAGDASTNILEVLADLKKDKIPVVITTQAPNGNSNFQVNKPGELIAKDKLAIPAYDMSIESQTTKLAWLLAKMKKEGMKYDQLCKEMKTDLRGEVNVIWEV